MDPIHDDHDSPFLSLPPPVSAAPSRPSSPAPSEKAASPAAPVTTSTAEAAKKASGRRIRTLALLAPAVLILLTLLSRHSPWSARATPLAHSLYRRQGTSSSSTSVSQTLSANPSTASGSASGTLAAAVPTTIPISQQQIPLIPPTSPPPPIPTPFPQPFDVSLSANFTSASCQTFFGTFTTDLNFRACRSFGLLLANSHAFFMSTNLSALNNILWGTCNTRPSADDCVATMDGLAGQIKTACAADLKANNALAKAALVGFSSYSLYRQAGCLPNARTGRYCYLEALAASPPSDVYFWSLPLGVPLPNNTVPTCSECTKALMGVWAGTAGSGSVGGTGAWNSSLPISRTYPTARAKAAGACGDVYAVAVNVGAGGRRAALPALGALAALVVAALVAVW